MEHEAERDTNCSGFTWNSPQTLGEETEGTGNLRKNREQTDHNIVKIDLNSQKNLQELR